MVRQYRTHMFGSANQPSWICSQLGAREHYAIPRALRQAGRTVSLYTDFWAGPPVRHLAFGALRRLAARHHPDLEKGGATKIKSWNARALCWEKRQRQLQRTQSPYQGFLETGRRFSERVREDLKRSKPGANSIFFAYDTGALEAMAWCREQNLPCVLNQMDPSRVEADLVRAEEGNWPGWALPGKPVPEEYFKRREQEWSLADRVVVNSRWSFEALVQQGVPAKKLVVIPLCFETGEKSGEPAASTRPAGQPLRVLFLGQVILRKGIQYLMQAAKELERENVRFDIVGPVGISPGAVATAPGNLTFHGRANRDQAFGWYVQSDVFVLPTLSDGFALTQLEAMAHGLPVIATDCCGEVVTDGADGFKVPVRAAGALAEVIRRYLAQPDLLAAQRKAALVKSRQFTLRRLAENLQRLEADLVK